MRGLVFAAGVWAGCAGLNGHCGRFVTYCHFFNFEEDMVSSKARL